MTGKLSFAAALRVALVAGLKRAFSAAVWFVILALGGVGLLVAGVYLLLGLAWAFVAAGGMALAVAALLLIGMNRGG